MSRDGSRIGYPVGSVERQQDEIELQSLAAIVGAGVDAGAPGPLMRFVVFEHMDVRHTSHRGECGLVRTGKDPDPTRGPTP